MIVSMSAPDAVDAPRERRPPRSRIAGPRTGRSAGVLLALGAAGALGAVMGKRLGAAAALLGVGAIIGPVPPASSAGGPCRAQTSVLAASADASAMHERNRRGNTRRGYHFTGVSPSFSGDALRRAPGSPR